MSSQTQGAGPEPPLSEAEVRRIAELSRLRLEPAEVSAMVSDLRRILDTVSEMMSVPVEGLEATLGVGGVANRFRADEPQSGLPRDRALANAPCQRDGHFEIPRILPKQTS